MDEIERYLLLAGQNRFAQGLPLIEEIVQRNPGIATSQFNYGVCLSNLGRHQEAAHAFLRAYSLNPEDGGALYRGCLSLAAANDVSGLLIIFRQECARDPATIIDVFDEEQFAAFWQLPDFKHLKDEYGKWAQGKDVIKKSPITI